MPNRLDTYLADIERRLRPMPEAERAGEIEEIRLHIEALSESYQSRGLDTDAAVNMAILQLGAARKVGGDIVTTWWRRDEPDPGSLTRAIATAIIWTCAWPMIWGLLLAGIIEIFGTFWASMDFNYIPQGMLTGAAIIGAPIAAGWMTGHTSPRHAISAMSIVYGPLSSAWITLALAIEGPAKNLLPLLPYAFGIIGLACGSAYAGRRRLNHRRRFLHKSSANAGGGPIHD